MGPDTAIRAALLVGVIAGLSWFLLSEEALASPVNSLVAGIIGFTITYAIASLVERALTSDKDRSG